MYPVTAFKIYKSENFHLDWVDIDGNPRTKAFQTLSLLEDDYIRLKVYSELHPDEVKQIVKTKVTLYVEEL